jgi:hypothetical protein
LNDWKTMPSPLRRNAVASRSLIAVDRVARDLDLARVGPVERPEQVQQRALPAPRLPHDPVEPGSVDH